MNSEKQSTNLQMTLREVNRVGERQKNVPKIRFKGYEDAWEQRKLEEFLKERTERAEGDEELLSVTINKGVIRQLESDKKNNSSENKYNYKLVYKGDIPYNSMRMWQGAVGVSQFEGIVSPAYTVLIPTEEADGKFLMELFKKSSSLQIFTRWSQGLTSDTWNLKYPTLSKISFFVPYIKEQNKIAKLLQELDDLITLHQRKYDALKSMKKTLLSKMFPKNGEDVPEIRFKGFTDAWEQRKLGDLCERVVRKNKNFESDLPLTIASQYGLIDQRNFFGKVVAAKDMSNYYLLKKGEFAYNKSYSKGFDFGSIKRLNNYEQGCLSTLYICFKISSNRVESDYLEVYFDTLNWYKDVMSICAEGARNHGLLNVDTKAFFEEVNVDTPQGILEQKNIALFLEKVDQLITLHQRKLDELKNMKKTLLQQMFV